MLFVPGIDVAAFQQVEQVFLLWCVVREDAVQFLGEPFVVAFQFAQIVGLGLIRIR